jgi:hypothetical protein
MVFAAYRSDCNDFTTWCIRRQFEPLPAEPATVALYVGDLVERCKPSTIMCRLATISQAHQQAGHSTSTTVPLVRDTMRGIGWHSVSVGCRRWHADGAADGASWHD